MLPYDRKIMLFSRRGVNFKLFILRTAEDVGPYDFTCCFAVALNLNPTFGVVNS